MVSPLPRYLQGRCCNQSEHVSNLHDQDYKEVQEEAILACRRNLKDFAFRLGLKTRVICPWSQLRNLEDDLRPTDPVHMDKKGYAAVAGQILVALQQYSSMDMEQSKKGGAVTSAQAEAATATADREQHPLWEAGGHREVGGEGEEPGGTEPSARRPLIPKKTANNINIFFFFLTL